MKMSDLLSPNISGVSCEQRIYAARSLIMAARLALTNDRLVVNEDTKNCSIETVMEMAVELLGQAEEDAEELVRAARMVSGSDLLPLTQ